MIGALAIKRRRKAGQLEVTVIPVKSRHCTCVYILGGVAFITGVILLIPAIIVNTNSTLFVLSGALLGGGLITVMVACCLSEWSDVDGPKDGNEVKVTVPELSAINGVPLAVENTGLGDNSSLGRDLSSPATRYERSSFTQLPLVST